VETANFKRQAFHHAQAAPSLPLDHSLTFLSNKTTYNYESPSLAFLFLRNEKPVIANSVCAALASTIEQIDCPYPPINEMDFTLHLSKVV
jgi:hypothetical protein